MVFGWERNSYLSRKKERVGNVYDLGSTIFESLKKGEQGLERGVLYYLFFILPNLLHLQLSH